MSAARDGRRDIAGQAATERTRIEPAPTRRRGRRK